MADWTDWLGIGGTVVGGIVDGYFQNKAVDQYTDSISQAQGISAEAAQQARQDIMDSFGPAYSTLQDSVAGSIDTLLEGRDSTANILSQTSQQAGDIISSTYNQARNDYLGGTPVNYMTDYGPSNVPGGQRGPYSTAPVNYMTDYGPSNVPGGQPQQAQYQNVNTGAMTQAGQTADPMAVRQQGMTAIAANPNDPAVQAEQAIKQQYAAQFGRTPDQAGLDYWKGQVASGALTQDQLAGAIGNAGKEYQLVQPSATAQQNPQSGGAGQGYGLNQARTDLTSSANVAGQQLAGGTQGALNQTLPFYLSGLGAQNQQAAFTGALGPEAQAQAFQNYQASPGQAWHRDQQEQALLRNQAAIGGLGGGNVRQELQRQAAGLASQNYQQDLNNLNTVANRGYGSATGQAGLLANLGSQLGALTSGTGGQLSNLAFQGGRDLAQMSQNQGAQMLGQTNQLGSSLANLEQQTGINIANLIGGLGQQQSGQISNLGSQLGNLALGLGTQQANLAQNMGQAQAAGSIGMGGNVSSGINNLMTMLGYQGGAQ